VATIRISDNSEIKHPEKPEDSKEIIVGIDASRNRSGGAIANLVGILREGDPVSQGIQEVHVWTYRRLADALPDRPWLVKHSPPVLEKSLLRQVWWQYHCLPKEARKARCDILYSTDAAAVCQFYRMVVMSQDMLSYEPGIMKYFGYGKTRIRLFAIKLIQNLAFRRADGVIFLTQYAADVIQKSCGSLSRIKCIPHGISDEFKRVTAINNWPTANERAIMCLYVSNFALYKHQWVVVRAISLLRKRGYNLQLILAGGGPGSGVDKAEQLLEKEIRACDPDEQFVKKLGFVPYKELPSLLATADLFIFASSCENMPNTLLEGMAVGLPIACSNRGPMPEILQDGGVYFDPEDVDSIARAVEQLLVDGSLRKGVAKRAKEVSQQYSWSRCAAETFNFIVETYRSIKP